MLGCVAFTWWCTGDKHLLGLRSLVSEVEVGAIACDKAVSDAWKVEVIILSPSLTRLNGHGYVGYEWTHIAAFN